LVPFLVSGVGPTQDPVRPARNDGAARPKAHSTDTHRRPRQRRNRRLLHLWISTLLRCGA